MATYVILHGTKGSPEGNWFPWLKKQLELQGHKVVVPLLPTPDKQSATEWHKAFKTQVPQADKDFIMIGHSAGATFLLHILEKLPQPITQAVFVSPVMADIGIKEYDTLNETFICHNFLWDKILKNAGHLNAEAGYDKFPLLLGII